MSNADILTTGTYMVKLDVDNRTLRLCKLLQLQLRQAADCYIYRPPVAHVNNSSMQTTLWSKETVTLFHLTIVSINANQFL